MCVFNAGKGRVFKCLQENIAKPDFGQNCAQEVEKRTSRMQEDYRLDYGIATKCETDVNALCADQKVRLTLLQGVDFVQVVCLIVFKALLFAIWHRAT